MSCETTMPKIRSENALLAFTAKSPSLNQLKSDA